LCYSQPHSSKGYLSHWFSGGMNSKLRVILKKQPNAPESNGTHQPKQTQPKACQVTRITSNNFITA
ncbi:MAG: hypothetical protein Q8807_03450, partial ['Waltheria sp.' little leaf phytoplasma]|nr:hypothetical protein ['Waltheria sp.' little leaf phytoplasma]